MMAVIKKSRISGNVRAPASKSHAIRLVLYSLIHDVNVQGLPDSSDVAMAVDFVGRLGIIRRENSFSRHRGALKHRADLYFGGSGTTLRMALPLLAYLGGEFTIDGDRTLRARPIKDEVRALSEAGISFSSDSIPLRMSGRAVAYHVTIKGSESSQSISGLIFALLMNGGGRIDIVPPIVSRHYIDLTCSILKLLSCLTGMEQRPLLTLPCQVTGLCPWRCHFRNPTMQHAMSHPGNCFSRHFPAVHPQCCDHPTSFPVPEGR